MRDIADSTGTVVNHLTFDSFGNITSQSDASVEFRFSFTGREFDEETGLYYFRARYLDPSTGQFISQDPIGFAAGDVNLYRYVGNSPLNFIDPSGNQAESPLQFNLSVESGSTIPQATINELRDRSNEIAEGSKTSLPETTINQTLARAREIAELRATEFSPVNPEPVSFDERTSVSPSAEAPEPPIAEAPEQPTLTPEPIIDEGADIIITQDDLPPRAPSPNQGTELSNSEHNPVPEPAVDEPEAEINEPEEPLPPRDPRPNRPRDPRRRVGPFVVSPDAVNGTDGPDVAGIQSTTSSTPGNTDSLASSPLFDSTPNPIAPLTAIDAFNNSSQALVTGAIVGGLALAAAPVTAAVVGVTLAVAVFGFSLRRRSQQAASLGRSQSVVDGSTLVGPLGRSEVETQLRVFTGAVGDITGVTQLIQGVTGRDFVTGATLSTQQRSEDLGTGVLSTATEVVGLITTADEVVRTFTANSRNSGPIRLSNSREVASESALGDAAEGIFPLVPGRRADNGALSDLDLSELTALRGAGLSDGEIARQLQLLGGTPLFRGTTRDFPGNPILQRLGISPASTDPLVATVFALEGKARGGDPIVLFGNAQDFGSPDINLGNVRRTLEREVAVGMSPSDFARNAPNSISADRARQILSELGVADLPPSIGSVQEATQILENTPRLTPEQILEFTRRAAN
nr:RHS repeat-associated core domain-containing protein [Synechococcus sp. PCC 7336]